MIENIYNLIKIIQYEFQSQFQDASLQTTVGLFVFGLVIFFLIIGYILVKLGLITYKNNTKDNNELGDWGDLSDD